ncbi:flagellar type III secretion system pore protein FliP [Parendozoicomonas haliclonae]|uniref:Flagellar biosynthetic protein FliP n=1 Tax=Parendozoicomonas haliclonae TaxID=1960125 RepID=A0A1X7ANG2_9GAMM|nr:flagellar type III secretion system pore protein FliP [Parendozoicomonas haliclonae]SMA49619.1 Flagellar biosynthetic protein FliP precursor [Parendozoicomonas haliclonae]
MDIRATSRFAVLGTLLITAGFSSLAQAQNVPLLNVINDGVNQSYSAPLQIMLLLTLLSFLPAMLMVLTSFTRIIVVFSLLRQALGLQQTPPNPVLVGLALFLTAFIMTPVYDEIDSRAIQPWMKDELVFQDAAVEASKPLKAFMLRQTREQDIKRMADISGITIPASSDAMPFRLLAPAFIISELKTAFQIGFLLFIPFLIIDLVVASVLMAMGMMMLSPLVISLPFKLMLFVLVDGWSMITGTLAASFW